MKADLPNRIVSAQIKMTVIEAYRSIADSLLTLESMGDGTLKLQLLHTLEGLKKELDTKVIELKEAALLDMNFDPSRAARKPLN